MEYLKPANAGPRTRDFIKNLVYDDILVAEGAPDKVKILRKLSAFEKEIRDSIMSGDPTHLKTAKIKTADAYADAMTIGPYKATYVWNHLFPDNKIEIPGVCHLIPVKLRKPQDFSGLSVTDPDLFNRLLYLFKQNKYIANGGITNIAIPLDTMVPDSLKPYIDMSDILSKTFSLLRPILTAIGIKSINKTKSAMYYSNFVDI